MLGLCVDPTVDTSDDDYQEPVLSDDVLGHIFVGECGVSASEVLFTDEGGAWISTTDERGGVLPPPLQEMTCVVFKKKEKAQ